jgi:hypothetical protein
MLLVSMTAAPSSFPLATNELLQRVRVLVCRRCWLFLLALWLLLLLLLLARVWVLLLLQMQMQELLLLLLLLKPLHLPSSSLQYLTVCMASLGGRT